MRQKVIHYPEYWAGKKLSYPNVPTEAGKFSRSIVVGNLIFISGCQGSNDETARVETMVFEEQMEIALGKIRRALEEAGSSMNNLIRKPHHVEGFEGLSCYAAYRIGILSAICSILDRQSAGQFCFGGTFGQTRIPG